jgi:hypothetical protein
MRHTTKLAILLFLTASVLSYCRRNLDPPRHHVSDKKLESIKVGASMQDVRRMLGEPSFISPSRVFESEHYPTNPACAATRPTQMWVYYERYAESAAVFFNSKGEVVCCERALMIIAY